MANKKISELQSRTPSLSDLMLVGDPSSGYSYKCTITALATLIETDIADGYVTIATTQTISGAKTFSNILTLTSVANATSDPDKFLVLNASNVVNYRTGSEVLSDIGGQGALTLTTTGTSGAATLVGNTLNIPQYQTALTNPVTGTGTTNYLAKFTGTSTIGNSILFDNGTNVGIGGSSPAYKLDVSGDIRSTLGAYFATSSGNIGFGTTIPTGSGGPILHIKAASIPEIHLTNSTTGDAYNDGFSLNVNGLNTYFTNYDNGFLSFSTNNTERVRVAADGNVTFSQIANATTDTDKFLVSDSGVIKYRTGSELLSDIGGQAALTNPVTGTGTTNYIPKFTSSSAIGNSNLQTDASGNLGLGVTPSAWVSGAGRTALQVGITSVSTNVGNDSFYGTNYYDDGSNNRYINNDFSLIYAQQNGNHVWYTAPSGTAGNAISFTQAMTLDASGRLGIGTTSPSTALEVAGSVRAYLNSATSTELFAENNTVKVRLIAGTSSSFLSTTTNHPLIFETNNTERMRITSGGNVGIGTTSPNFTAANRVTVDINGTSSAGLSLSAGGTSYGFLYVNSGAYVMGTGASSAAIPISFETSGSERMRITSGGNVGIGTSTPGSKLAVVGLPTSATGLSAGDFYRDGDGYVLVVL
jgi:hypothetical protein